MTVEYFTTKIPGDYNQHNRHALVNGIIEFFASPYTNYIAENKTKLAVLGNYWDHTVKPGKHIFSAVIYLKRLDNSGKTDYIDSKQFTNQDECFEWAAEQLK